MLDYSGVISDDRKPVYEADMTLLERYGKSRMTFDDWLIASKASAGEFLQSIGVKVPIETINEDYEQVYTEIVTRKENPITPFMYPGTKAVLSRLSRKNFILAIVSTHPQSNLLKELDNYKLINYFHEISGDPSPKTPRLLKICTDFKTHPSDAFFVEDTVQGLHSGYDAGVKLFGITTGYHSRKMLEAEKKRLNSNGNRITIIDTLAEIFDHID